MSDPHSVLIDTCAMAALSIYCEFCDARKKTYGTSSSELFGDLPTHLKNEYFEEEAIKHGYQCYKYLRDLKQNGDIVFYFSKLVKVELLDVFLDVSFDEMLVREGISFRLRRKKPLRWQVNFDYNKKVSNRYATIEKCLDGLGISISCPEADLRSSYRQAFEINDILSSHIFLDSVDSYLFSLSVFLMVDEIITFDHEFKNILNEFRASREWKKHREYFEYEVIKIVPQYQSLCVIESKPDSHGKVKPRIDLGKFKLPVLVSP